MKKHMQLHYLGVVWLLCLSLLARGQTTITINGLGGVCLNSLASYSVTPTTGVTYTWSVNTLGNIPSSAMGPSVTANWTTVGTGVISVQGHDEMGTLVEQGNKNVTITAIPNPTITTNTRVDRKSTRLTS